MARFILRRSLLSATACGLCLTTWAHAEETHTRHSANAAAKPVRFVQQHGTAAPSGPSRPSKSAELQRVPLSPKSEDIVVVGSALASGRAESSNPVQIISSRDIQRTSAVTLGDYLQRLPSMGSQGTYNTTPNGGSGESCPDIRNLGSNRALVLIDGKRQVATTPGCVDLNTIAIDTIESVEILKDGGSELYGADAVSGVINIKLKHNVDTGGIDIRGAIAGQGDARTGKISGFKGFNFDQGRGNVSVFGQYMTQGGVSQRSRSWATNSWNSDPLLGHAPSFGSSVTPYGRAITDSADVISNGNGTFSDYTRAENDRFSNLQSLSYYLQTANLRGDAHYDVTDHLTAYVNANYSHRSATQNMAGQAVTGSVYPSNLLSSLILPSGSPYNVWGEDATLLRRFNEGGGREYIANNDTWQVNAGIKGDILGGWKYDISMGYGNSTQETSTTNLVNYQNVLNSLGVRQLNPMDSNSGAVYDPGVCSAAGGCSLINPFMPLGQSAQSYIFHTSHSYYNYQMRDFNARVSKSNVVTMPYRHGGKLGIAFGVEHLSEQASYKPDSLQAAGVLAGSSAQYTGGGFNSTSAYLEGKLSLLEDAPYAKQLSLDAQGRWSHYNTFGNTENWKVGLYWAPTRDIAFRGTLGTSFRQPNVNELYGGQNVAQTQGEDPCAQASSYGAYASAVTARCAAQGINVNNFSMTNANTVETVYGGNRSLQPEEARTYTFGTIITPRVIPNLTVSGEFWHYHVSNAISQTPLQYVMDGCYTGAAPGQCQYVSPRTAAGQLSTVYDLYENLGAMQTSGVDFDLNYRIHITHDDLLTLSNNFQWLVSYKQQNYPGGPQYDYAGKLLYQNDTGQPRARDYATVGWRHRNFSLTYMMNFIGGMHYSDGTNNVSCSVYAYCKVPGIFSHDITAQYTAGPWNFTTGINNVFAKNPPFVPDGAYNTATGVYGSLIYGRYFFLQVQRNF
ncbi:TonB-dependent receptor plug domain-containing protein [Gluconobacter aidae]|uniref:TonB-dependent receptor n=1 Tax=Gluconobacter aidae TaxID=2662454 RepID=A0A7X1SQF4_9PROT|nr:TonB-dependent receptor [Gluconobacter aidae]MQR99286.1 TonB-dependent receptor [Gluconobacter aidae]